jgi:sugar (pentulose or hexulose) kinase
MWARSRLVTLRSGKLFEHFYLFCGTLSGVWLAHELYEIFGIKQKLNGATAQATYDELADMLGEPLMTLEVADTSATGAGLLGLYALGLIDAALLRVAITVEPGPVYTPYPGRHKVYKQHHREHWVLCRGMVAMGEALENLKEGFL